MAKKVTEVDVRDSIMNHLKADDRRLTWLAKMTKLSYAHLYFVFVKKERELTDENRIAINKILDTDF